MSLPKFAAGIGLGLADAIKSDEDVFLMATMGLLLGSRSEALKGVGKAVGMYVAVRRVDKIAGYFAQLMLVNRQSADQ